MLSALVSLKRMGAGESAMWLDGDQFNGTKRMAGNNTSTSGQVRHHQSHIKVTIYHSPGMTNCELLSISGRGPRKPYA